MVQVLSNRDKSSVRNIINGPPGLRGTCAVLQSEPANADMKRSVLKVDLQEVA